MDLSFDIASDQIDGARDYQEDAFMVSNLGETEKGENSALLIMADGMGGHAAGNVASNMVVATFNKTFQSLMPNPDINETLRTALLKSNDQIRNAVQETPALSGMGCTMVTAYIENEAMRWVSVGDSHLYLIRGRELTKLNADHSYGGFLDMMSEQGMDVTEQQGMSRNMLMSAMTGEEISSIDIPEKAYKLKDGDRVIVASDGLDTLGHGAIIQYSSWSNTARECVYALLKAVEEANRPNQDNTTIVVMDVIGAEESGTQKGPQAPARMSDVEDESSGSAKWIKMALLLIVLGAAAAGGWFAWQSGMLDEVLDPYLNPPVEPEPATTPAPVLEQPQAEQAEVPDPPAAEQVETSEPVEDTAETSIFTDRLRSGGSGPQMVIVPAGRFRMGGVSAVAVDEVPKHEVSINSFAISSHEITYAEYDRFASATGRKKPSSNGWDRKTHPLVNISWDDALAYTQWLSQQTGHKYRIPSEAEWEYAARGGSFSKYWWGSKVGVEKAHCFDCRSGYQLTKPTKVGQFEANPFGLFDTAGNVYEWVYDCYHPNYSGAPANGSVWEGGDCSQRVARGGSYLNPSSEMRVSNRAKFPANQANKTVGLRLARDL